MNEAAENKQAEVQQRVLIRIGADEIDVTEMPPLTLGDKKALKREGLEWSKLLKDGDPELDAKFALHVLRKFRPATTEEEVDALPLLVAQRLFEHVFRRTAGAPVDRPFSTPSTPSPPSMAGVKAS